MITRFMIQFTALTATLATTLFGADGAALELVSKAHVARPNSFGDSGELELSADGKWAVFTSSGNGIVTNDHNEFNLDVFLRNLESGETTVISGNNGVPNGLGNGNSYAAQISAGGEFVLFESEASNLVTGDNNDGSDLFLYTRTNATLTLLSVIDAETQIEGASGGAVLSGDGRFVFLETDGNNVSALDGNNSMDLYRLDLSSGAFELVSAQSNNLSPAGVAFPSTFLGSFEASASADGRFVAFISAGTNHTPGVPRNAAPQIYLRDMVAQTNAWLTRVTNGVAAGNVSTPVVSSNGEVVIFLSSALFTNSSTSTTAATFLHRYDIASGTLSRVAAPASVAVEQFVLSENGLFLAYSASNHIWLHDLTLGTTTRVSSSPDGQPAGGVSAEPDISADGNVVVFTSTSADLVGGETGSAFQTYRYDRATDQVRLLSRAAGEGPESGGNEDTIFPVISKNGEVAGFMSYASNLTTNDVPSGYNVFVVSGTNGVSLVSAAHPLSIAVSASGHSFVEANALSLDGRFVIFSSEAPDIVANDTNPSRDIFLRDLQSGTTSLISVNVDGSAHSNSVSFVSASVDAKRIAYLVNSTPRHVYVYNRMTRSNTLASILPSGSAVTTTGTVMLSPDGRYLVFRELNAATSPLYVRDLDAGVTRQHPAPGGTTFGTAPVAISPSGRYLLTIHQGTSYAVHDLTGPLRVTNITSTALASQPFAADDATMLVSTGTVNSAVVMLQTLDGSREHVPIATNAIPIAISPDGNTAAYLQTGSGRRHLNFFDARSRTSTALMQDGTNVTVNLRSTPMFSADSRYFVFSITNALVPASHSFSKLYVYDTVLKTVQLAGVNATGEAAEFGVTSPTLSANGRVIVFDTPAANLVAGDLNLASDVFVTRLTPTDSDTDGLEDGWETIYFGGLTMNGAADSDSDGVSNSDEFRSGTNPNSAGSTLSLELEINRETETITISAPASPGFAYQLQHRADLDAGGWENIGEATVSLSSSVAFEAPLLSEEKGFFRIVVVN